MVLHELLAGISTPEQARLVDARFARAFELRGRLVAPSVSAWRRAGMVVRRLLGRGGGSARPGLANDVLLAVSCRENGMILVTRDADFRRIAPLVPGLRVVRPLPGPRRPGGAGARRDDPEPTGTEPNGSNRPAVCTPR